MSGGRRIVHRLAHENIVPATFVGAWLRHMPPCDLLSAREVGAGVDAADHVIVGLVTPFSVVVTGDYDLALRALVNGAIVLDWRGRRYNLVALIRRAERRKKAKLLHKEERVQYRGRQYRIAQYTIRDAERFERELNASIRRILRRFWERAHFLEA